MSLVAIVMVIAFGWALLLSRVLWKSAYSRSNMKPKSVPKQARAWMEALFCWFQVLRQHFMFLAFYVHTPFILHACPVMFLSLSFNFYLFPFILQCAFLSLHLPFICIHLYAISLNFFDECPLIFFFKVLETALWLGQRRSATNDYP